MGQRDWSLGEGIILGAELRELLKLAADRPLNVGTTLGKVRGDCEKRPYLGSEPYLPTPEAETDVLPAGV